MRIAHGQPASKPITVPAAIEKSRSPELLAQKVLAVRIVAILFEELERTVSSPDSIR